MSIVPISLKVLDWTFWLNAKNHQVLLSQIDWMWGAEMGANECGVVIGHLARTKIFGRCCCYGWWQLKYFLFPPLFGEMIQFDEHIFSDGLVQPPTLVFELSLGNDGFLFFMGIERKKKRITEKKWWDI